MGEIAAFRLSAIPSGYVACNAAGAMRFLIAAFRLATVLLGCYNPRYASETPGAEPAPRETGNSQETSVRDRRNAAAASGSTVKSE